MSLGPLEFRHAVKIEGPIFLAGSRFTECVAEFDASKQPAGTRIQKLFGGSVIQRTPGLARAPLDLEPESVRLRFMAADEEAYFLAQRAYKFAAGRAPVSVFYCDPLEDVWPIGATAQTVWTLSRSLPYGLVGFSEVAAPRAWIVDDPDDGSDATELDVVAPGPPGVGDVAIADDASSATIETLDLSAEAGRFLVFRYYPLRRFVFSSLSRQGSEPNGLDFEVGLEENVPSRSAY